MNIYEIEAQINLLMSEAELLAEQNDGEIPATYLEQIDNLKMAQKDKWINVGLFIKNTQADVVALDNEIKRLTERKRTALGAIDRLKQYITSTLPVSTKIDDPRCTLSWRKSKSLIIDNDLDIDPLYLRELKYVWDKKLLKEAVEKGEEVTGVHIEEKNNLQIR